jgi:hypothetical protein
MLTLSPKLGNFLIKAAETADIDMALRKILFEYLDLKLKELQGQTKNFEEKWGMPLSKPNIFRGKGKRDGTIFN